MVDGFALELVVVPSPRVATTLFAALPNAVSVARAEETHPVRIEASADSLRSLAPMEGTALIQALLPALLAPPVERTGFTLFWLDASTAREEDIDGWSLAFARINERRNAIQEALRAPLLLVIPPRLEAPLAHHAPDLWSVRSSVTRVKLADSVELEVHRAFDSRAPRTRYVLNLMSELDVRIDENVRAEGYAAIAHGLAEAGEQARAIAVADAGVREARAFLEAHPDSRQAQLRLIEALRALSDARSLDSDRAASMQINTERGALCEALLSDSSSSTQLLREAAWAFYSLAIDERPGSNAIAFARRSADLATALVALDPSDENKVIRATCVTVLGEQLKIDRQRTEAIEQLSAALAILDGLPPGRAASTHATITSRLALANLVAPAEASRLSDEALVCAKHLTAQRPLNLDVQLYQVIALAAAGQRRAANGDVARALGTLEEGRTLAAKLRAKVRSARVQWWSLVTVMALLRLDPQQDDVRRVRIEEAEQLVADLRPYIAGDTQYEALVLELDALLSSPPIRG